jgi:hypothetical protein
VLDKPTQVDQEIYAAVERLFDENWVVGTPVRLVGSACVLGDGVRQLGLFEDAEAERKREGLDRLKDQLRARFGSQAIGTGRDFTDSE